MRAAVEPSTNTVVYVENFSVDCDIPRMRCSLSCSGGQIGVQSYIMCGIHLILYVPVALSSETKRPGRETDHLHFVTSLRMNGRIP